MRLVQGILILISINTLICSPVALLGFTATWPEARWKKSCRPDNKTRPFALRT